MNPLRGDKLLVHKIWRKRYTKDFHLVTFHYGFARTTLVYIEYVDDIWALYTRVFFKFVSKYRMCDLNI